MLGLVHRRPDQIVHRRVDDDDPALTVLDVDHAGNEHAAGGDEKPTRLEGQRHIERTENLAHHRRVLRRAGGHFVPIRHRQPAAEIDLPHRQPFAAQRDDQLGDPRESRAAGRQIDDLRADMHGKSDRLDPRQIGGKAIGGHRLAMRDAEFVLLAAGRDVAVGLCVDIGIDPDRDPRRVPRAAASSLSRCSSGTELDIDLVDVCVERRLELGTGLADPREKNALRGHAGGKSAAQLAFGNDIGAGAEGGEEPQNGEVGIGLDRVADQRLLAEESVGKTLVLGGEGRCGIKVKGGADGSRDPRNRDLFGVQLTAAIGKEITHSDRGAERCWVHRAEVPARPFLPQPVSASARTTATMAKPIPSFLREHEARHSCQRARGGRHLIPKTAFSPRQWRRGRSPGRCRQSSSGSPPNDRGPAHRKLPG